MRADTARAKNAKNSMLIAATEESVNMLSLFSLILLVSGTADDAADNNMYAITCNSPPKSKKFDRFHVSRSILNQERAVKALV